MFQFVSQGLTVLKDLQSRCYVITCCRMSDILYLGNRAYILLWLPLRVNIECPPMSVGDSSKGQYRVRANVSKGFVYAITCLNTLSCLNM